ncbi:hypothetical protein PsorP6_009712 [Peronosclerospora sorghi]|uniref:Uncharacterized protein n=1 Tax=Peronosclerospora sorghi TaxID=230839 RepID=A0ACC0VZR2_9STRA|nr:hypothetical protein PsorP6_009712 [Peronosclerospora sorghi]
MASIRKCLWVFNVEKHMTIIGGTFYGGEMIKGIFSMINYCLPLNGFDHACVRQYRQSRAYTAIFFGLSGTGTTTLLAEPKRELIGDDEHGWDDEGVFNFEGGWYAETIDLSKENETDVFDAIRPNATKTENGRVLYPIYHLPHHEPDSRGNHPNAVIFLTCDAYGVLPPLSKLSTVQAQYHFLSEYTAKVVGTERAITEPLATFFTCFGAAFMTLHPTKYADLLKKKLQENKTPLYLINTGCTGGVYGVGKRMKLSFTRKFVGDVLDGSTTEASFVKDKIFGFEIPVTVKGVPSEILNPRDAWSDKAAFDQTALRLAKSFKENFKKFILPESDL